MTPEILEVSLGDRSYPIYVGRNLENQLQARLERDREEGRGHAVITDQSVSGAMGGWISGVFANLPRLELPPGESTKSFAMLEKCCDFLAGAGLDRGGRVFAVGGGVIGDLAGFAAASYFRGIGFYQVPTTLLAMVDSSIGGKTGINLTVGKNLVGAFHQPLAVYSDLDTLHTLPAREFNCGMAEIIKHGLLADESMFTALEKGERLQTGSSSLADVVRRNCEIKAGVVREDERESSAERGRALLNLGHTFGHAIEAVCGYGTLLHGEAVSIGLVLAGRLSQALGYLGPEEVDRIINVVKKYDLPDVLPVPLPVGDLLAAARKDKKARAGKARYVILESLGRAAVREGVDDLLIRELWLTAGAREE